jgi:hypothetical protein
MVERMAQERLLRILEDHSVPANVSATWREFRGCLTSSSDILVTPGEAIRPSELAHIYTIRERIDRKRGIETPGQQEVVDALRQETQRVQIIAIETERFYGLCFTTSNLSRVIGFLYTPREPGSRSLASYSENDMNLLGEIAPPETE